MTTQPVEIAKGWSWCPVMERFIKDEEGHRPAATIICNGTDHLPALIGQNEAPE